MPIKRPKGRNKNYQTDLLNQQESCRGVFGSKKVENQEGLDIDCVGYLLGDVLGVIIGISVGKYGVDKVGRWLGRILGTVLNTKCGYCEGFSLY